MTDIRTICNLSDKELAARRKELREGLLPQARGREDLSDGLALFFDASPELREELEAFVAFERECCPGLGFSVRDVSGALHLEIRGIDPRASIFAGVGEVAEHEKPERAGWIRLLRSAGLGTAGAFVLFCVVPMGIAAVGGAQLAASLGALDDPWAVGAGGVVFAALLWLWERRRAAARKASASTGGGGC